MFELLKSGIFHFNKRTALHCLRIWFSACGCGVDTGSTTNSVSETCFLAETEASNSRAWVAVTSGDITGSGGVLAWGSIPKNKEATLQLETVRNSSWNCVTLCDLFPVPIEPNFITRNFT